MQERKDLMAMTTVQTMFKLLINAVQMLWMGINSETR